MCEIRSKDLVGPPPPKMCKIGCIEVPLRLCSQAYSKPHLCGIKSVVVLKLLALFQITAQSSHESKPRQCLSKCQVKKASSGVRLVSGQRTPGLEGCMK
jgi:hypothetical protein